MRLFECRNLVSVGLLLFCVNGLAETENWPERKHDDETLALLITPEQRNLLINKVAYSEKSPEGVCYGVAQMNFALLTNIDFVKQPDKRDTFPEIQEKLIRSARDDGRQTINGFENGADFIHYMDNVWEDNDNPLQGAIETLQLIQPDFHAMSPRMTKALCLCSKDKQMRQSRELESKIHNGTPVFVGIYDDTGIHELIVVGYRRRAEERYPSSFFVLDSVYPRELKELEIRKTRWVDGQEVPSESYWYYPPWEESEQQKLNAVLTIDPKDTTNFIQAIFAVRGQHRYFRTGDEFLSDTFVRNPIPGGHSDIREKLANTPLTRGGEVFLETTPMRNDQYAHARETLRITLSTPRIPGR